MLFDVVHGTKKRADKAMRNQWKFWMEIDEPGNLEQVLALP